MPNKRGRPPSLTHWSHISQQTVQEGNVQQEDLSDILGRINRQFGVYENGIAPSGVSAEDRGRAESDFDDQYAGPTFQAQDEVSTQLVFHKDK